MASCSSSFFTGLATFLLLLLSAESAIAPGPKPAPLNLTGVLEKGAQYTTFLRMLKETQVGQQIESQLNSSFNGLTIFAPTDNAFNNLKAGTLNSLAPQDQVNLILYHVLPRYYSVSTFETTSNPVNTQASGNTGVYTVNITSTSNQINVSTGVNEAPVSNALYVDFPLAVYSVDQVLLPNELFGAKPPAEAPSPAAAPVKPKTKTKSSPAAAVAEAPASDETTASAASLKGGSVGGGLLLLGIGLVGIGSLF